MVRKIILISVAFAMLVSLSGQALALCSGSACNGTDPASTGCASSAATVRQKWPYGNPGPIKLELRFSDDCNTFWARSWNFSGFDLYINATLRNRYWHQRLSPTNDSTYSSQRYGSTGFQACGDYKTPANGSFTGPVNGPSGLGTSTY